MTVEFFLFIFFIIVFFYFGIKFIIKSNLQNSGNTNINNINITEEIYNNKSESNIPFYMVLDIETSGLPKYRNADYKDFNNWPYPVELAYCIFDKNLKFIKRERYILKQNIVLSEDVINIHGISNSKMKNYGIDPKIIYEKLINDYKSCLFIIGHNIKFDLSILQCDLYRNNFDFDMFDKNVFCTMLSGKEITYNQFSQKYKFPKLKELYGYLYYKNVNININNLHSALMDVYITYLCFKKIKNNYNHLLSNFNNYISFKKQYSFKGDILKKDLSKADKNSIFYNKKITFSGIFYDDLNKYGEILKYKMGADIDTGISPKTDFLIIGENPGNKKLEIAKENNINIIKEDEFYDILNKYKENYE